MILEEDSLLTFSYDASSDILLVQWPDLINTPLPQIENSLKKLCSIVANYDVKKLLLDLSTGVIGVDEKQYRELVVQFMASLTETRLQKIARVIPANPALEYKLQEYSQEVKSKLDLPFLARSFSRKEEAEAWLNS